LGAEAEDECMDMCASSMQMMSMAAPAIAAPPKVKPSFQSLITAQDSNGFWSSSSTSMILQFLSNPSEVSSFLTANKDIETIILTLLAIEILEFNFAEFKAEWDMISSKAKKWIRQQNLDADRKRQLDYKTKEFAKAMS